jgi:polyferredoxin
MDPMKNTNRFISVPALRTLVQAAFTLFCLYAGFRFYQFYQWAMGETQTYVPRPPSVEGFLPISALLGFKRFVLTGLWDDVHPAGLTIFMAAMVIALLLRKGFCGWICPVGFVSNVIEKAGKKIQFIKNLPSWLDYPLLSLKYALLAFFLYVILWRMDLRTVDAFIHGPYNKIVDGKMLLFFLEPSKFAMQILVSLVLISLVLRNFWCRYLCPYGALLGLLAFFGPSQVKRDEKLCIDCKQCDKTCPASISVSRKHTVRSPECIGCMECVDLCPQKGCMTFSVPRGAKLPVYVLPAAVLAVFLLFWATATTTGHWETSMTADATRKLYPLSSRFGHP